MVAAILIVVLLPTFCRVALAIKIESPGSSVFVVQDRLDRRGRRFGLVKFRTMRLGRRHTGSEWITGIMPVGRVLRDFRLDGLPQVINVIRGDMNLVDLGWQSADHRGPTPPSMKSQLAMALALVALAVFAILQPPVILAWISALLR